MHTATARVHAQPHQHPGPHSPSATKPKLYNPRHPEQTLLYRTVTGKRNRAQQGSLLPGLAADTGVDPYRCPQRAALPDLSLQIVEFAREHGRVTIGDAIKLTGVSRNTLKQHFRNLGEHGHLNQRGSGRGVWYELK